MNGTNTCPIWLSKTSLHRSYNLLARLRRAPRRSGLGLRLRFTQGGKLLVDCLQRFLLVGVRSFLVGQALFGSRDQALVMGLGSFVTRFFRLLLTRFDRVEVGLNGFDLLRRENRSKISAR